MREISIRHQNGDSAVSWQRTGFAMWVATCRGRSQSAGVVSERRRGVFTVICSEGHDLSTHQSLEEAQNAFQEHHWGFGAWECDHDTVSAGATTNAALL